MTIYISLKSQILNPPVRPVCPEAPVWPVEPLAPETSHNSSHCVTCLPPSLQCSGQFAMPMHISMGRQIRESQSLNPPVRPVCPEAPVWPVEPLAPASRHDSLHWLTGIQFLCDALRACHACMHLNGKPESTPTCETRLPRSPSLASGAARPCTQSQCLTLCHMPALLCAKL